jgi:NADPH-dependent FMN reductase
MKSTRQLMPKPHIQIIIGSIREGRVGGPVGRWFAEVAAARQDLTSELVDLRDWNLPFLTAPPRRRADTRPISSARGPRRSPRLTVTCSSPRSTTTATRRR